MQRLLFLVLILFNLSVQAQKKYSLDLQEVNALEALNQLSSDYDLKFSFNPKLFEDLTVSTNIETNSLSELIKTFFKDLPFDLQQRGGVYLVIPSVTKNNTQVVSGSIKDKDTGDPLAFAHIITDFQSTVSDEDGKFNLTLVGDSVDITIKYVGYSDQKIRMAVSNQLSIDIEQDPVVLPEIILSTNASSEKARPSFISVNPKQMDALPSLGGTDLLKSLQLLPGISGTNESAPGLSVRGGLPSQNLVLLEGFTLYHLDHVFGIYSTLNPEMISNVNVYKGGWGPEYGGRISSVIDVTGKAGSFDEVRGGIGVNALSYNGYLELPIGAKSSLMIGGRRSFNAIIESPLYQEFLTSSRQSFLGSIDEEFLEIELAPSLRFHDANLKYRTMLSNKSLLDVNLYTSEDFYEAIFQEREEFFSYGVTDISTWNNLGASVNWYYDASPRWSMTNNVSYSSFFKADNFEIDQTFLEEIQLGDSLIEKDQVQEFFNYDIESEVNDLTVKSEHEIILNDDNIVKAGIEFNRITTDFFSSQFVTFDFARDTLLADDLYQASNLFGIYAGYQYNYGNLTTNLGVRINHFTEKQGWYPEPRMDIAVKVNDMFSLKGAASLHHQFINEASLTFYENSDQLYWVMANQETYPVQKSLHLIFGGLIRFKDWSIDLEYYQKNTDGILENQFIVLPPSVEKFEDINFSGENLAEGLDFLLKYRRDRFTSWISYNLGSSSNSFWYRSRGQPTPAINDQRHEINLVNMVRLGKWELSNTILFGSGRPYTPPNPDPESDSIYDLERINAERLPVYFRMDFSAKHNFNVGKGRGEIGLTLFNFTDHANLRSRQFAKQFRFKEVGPDEFEEETGIIPIDTYLLGFTPNFFINLSF